MRALLFPVLLAAAAVGTATGLARGLPPAILLGAVTIGMAVIVIALERWLPFAATWQQAHGDVVTDVLHLTLTGALVGGPALGLGAVLLSAGLAARMGSDVWPVGWPLLAQLPLAVVVTELFGYGFHRLEHRGGALWRLHAVHHSAPRLYWLNASRLHPLEGLLYSLVTMVPLLALGAGEPVIALFSIFAGAYRLLQHSNVDFRLGPLNAVFSMAQVHRWHHSRRPDESNANFGAVLLLWDHLFGTYRYPADRSPPLDIGLGGLPQFPQTWPAQLAAPFRARLWR